MDRQARTLHFTEWQKELSFASPISLKRYMYTSIFGTNAQFVAPIALYQDHCVSSLRLLCCNLHNLYKDNEHTMCWIASNTLPAAQLPPASISWCTLPRLVDRGSKQSSVQGFPGVMFRGASIIRFQDSDYSILAPKTLIRDGNSAHNGKKVKTPHNGVQILVRCIRIWSRSLWQGKRGV